MPTYDYKCSSCESRFTKKVSMNERHKVNCPNCGQGPATQIFTSVNIMGGGSNNCNVPSNSRFT